MPKIVGVRFKDIGKIYYFSPNEIEFEVGDGVIVETVRGVEFGKVALAVREVDESQLVSPLKPVIRKATEKDFETAKRNLDKKGDAMKVAKEKIEKHKLNMKLIDCEFTFDNTKVIFYFTSETRVDFRELVKDLAGHFRIRIELRQVGIRDEAKLLGGLGPCGRADSFIKLTNIWHGQDPILGEQRADSGPMNICLREQAYSPLPEF